MSDSSTQANEPQKTCGTCFYGAPRRYGHWTKNDLICLKHAVSTNSGRHHVTECGWGTSGPKGWHPKCGSTLEQRCQLLEQLARDMYRAIAPMHRHCCEETCASLGDMGWDADCCLHGFREQLEALGVRLDD